MMKELILCLFMLISYSTSDARVLGNDFLNSSISSTVQVLNAYQETSENLKLIDELPPDSIFHPITDLACLNMDASAELTVYTQKWAPEKPGHAFISIVQENDTLVYGFYPAKRFPINFAGPGILGNDTGRYYDNAWYLGEINPEQLKRIVEITHYYNQATYLFLARNCVDFVVETMMIKGMDINNSGVSTPSMFNRMITPYADSHKSYAPNMSKSCPSGEILVKE